MKAVILAAGKGTRMLPLTEDKPKVLVEVNGKPFLSYVIENLKKAGFDEFGIVVGYLGEKIKEFCQSEGIEATFIVQSEQKGTGHALLQARDFCGSDNFVMLNGDNLFSVDDLKAVNNDDEFSYVVGKEEDNWQQYGVFVVENGMLVKVVEKPAEFVSNLINIGLYKFTSEIWEALDKIELSSRGEYELTCAIDLLAQEGKVKFLKLHDYWLDLGSKEDIGKIEEFLTKNI